MLALPSLHRQSIHRLVLGIAAALAAPVWAQTPPVQNPEEEDVVSLDELQVEGTRPLEATGEMRDLQGYDDVYERNLSTAYIGKEMVERFKGAAPADVLKGLLNVHSGDARNSGALDPNIRGIQGPGRVPVTIDGTEQALTVYRGYNGANNRNYIDPNLIGGIQVFKGPNLERDVLTSVGGAVAIKTLDADDILREGQNFGMELRVEGSNNAVAPRIPTLLTGRYRDDVVAEIPGWRQINDRTLYVRPRTSRDNTTFSMQNDYAYRAAIAGRLGNISLMAAYAYRDKGNHFAGKHDSTFYTQPAKYYDQIRGLATAYFPGDEVPNSSSELESWLLKATWKPTANQQLQFGYRTTQNHYGEIMPSRMNWDSAREHGAPQWPLSHVDMKAYNLSYRWLADNPWLDVHVNLWRTDSVSDTYTTGGFVNDSPDFGNQIIRNTALGNATNDRNGITLSNRMQLGSKLNLTIGGNFQHEKLGSIDRYDDPSIASTFRMFPRAGRREEYDLHFNFEWQPVERLTLTAGARYSSYWSMDDLLAAMVADGKSPRIQKVKGRTIRYYTQEVTTEELILRLYPNYPEAWLPMLFRQYAKELAEGLPWPQPIAHLVDWHADANGRLHRTDNPCTNGMLDDIPNHYHHQDPSVPLCQLVPTGSLGSINGVPYDIARGLVESVTLTSVEKNRGYGWVPAASAAWQLGEHTRLYVRHTQAIRYPSMFESAIGFSASPTGWGIKPERAFNNEIAYVHDYSDLISGNGYANVKLAYFHHLTKNVIERGRDLNFWNADRQTIRGVEFQGRFDNGFFFADLGFVRNFENEVCDEHTAVLSDVRNGRIPDCVKGGHVSGYLLSMVIPEFSANGLVGGRFFNRRLETGMRITYHKRHENDFFDFYRSQLGDSVEINNRLSLYWNVPLEWGSITLIDAYINWRFSERFVAELTGTNLGDVYHIDPLTRSAFPAPGRTLKLALTYRF